MYGFYIGTTPQKPPGNIIKICLDEQGRLIKKECYEAKSPAYLCKDGKNLFAVIENRDFGGIEAFEIEDDGTLKKMDTLDTKDVYSTYLSKEKGGAELFVANYGTPSCCIYDYLGGRLRHKIILKPGSDEKSHIHCAVITPDRAFLCLLDVGEDFIYLYDRKTYKMTGRLPFPKSTGPRHMVFSEKTGYAYVITESSSEIYQLRYCPEEPEKLQILDSWTTMPKGFGGASGICISPDGRFLLAGNRQANSITVFSIEANGSLVYVHHEIVPPGCPRDFQLTPDGKFVIVGLQSSDCLAVYSLLEGRMESRGIITGIDQPTCIIGEGV